MKDGKGSNEIIFITCLFDDQLNNNKKLIGSNKDSLKFQLKYAVIKFLGELKMYKFYAIKLEFN